MTSTKKQLKKLRRQLALSRMNMIAMHASVQALSAQIAQLKDAYGQSLLLIDDLHRQYIGERKISYTNLQAKSGDNGDHEFPPLREAVDWPEDIGIGPSFFSVSAIRELNRDLVTVYGKLPGWL